MNRELVLVVEDNAITAKMVQVTLQTGGYRVLVAHDAQTALRIVTEDRPALILQDLLLPDMDGVELLRRIRTLPEGANTPVIVCSGLLSKIEEARNELAPFTDYLFKPVDTGQLLQSVQRLLPNLDQVAAKEHVGVRVLLVDDDPVQLKLNSLQLQAAGYTVESSNTGADAMSRAERSAPDAFVIDLLMPDMNGFELCERIRRHHSLSTVPVVIASSTYGNYNEKDQSLATKMGANALVSRTPSLELVIEALDASLRSPMVPIVTTETSALHNEFKGKLAVQLERQVALSNSLTRRVALDSTLLAVTTGAASIVNEHRDLADVVRDVLAHTLDAGGVSSGAVYLCDRAGEPQLYAHLGFASERLPGLHSFFGYRELLNDVARSGVARHLHADDFARANASDLPERSGMPAILLEPLVVRGTSVGILAVGASRFESMQEWVDTVRSIGSQLAQAVVLSQTLDALRASEENFRQLFDANPYPMLVLDHETLAIVASNESAREFFERAPSELESVAIGELIDGTGAREQALARIRGTAPMVQSQPTRYKRRSGTYAEMELSSRSVQFAGKSSYILIVHDVTDREFLQRQVMQAQKMEAVGLLAGGVAHDFNNLLTVIKSCSSMLSDDLAPNDPRRENVTEISLAAERAAVLTRQLLAFSRRQVLDPKSIAVSHVVSDLERMLRRLIPTSIDFALALDPQTGSVLVDAGQFEQVVVNLVVNARDAMPHGGQLNISTSNVTLNNSPFGEDVSDGSYVLLEVADTGTGMDEETRARIFEPFFTTKPRGQGTGLGLSTVYGIVNQSRGHIRVISVPDRGTTFQVYFPRIEQAVNAGTASARTETSATGHETIMVVEDEEAVRRIVCRTLKAMGYVTLEARNGEEALALAETLTQPPDLLLSDVVMPRLNGFELMQRLVVRWPGLRVLFMSGYSDLPGGQTIAPKYAFIQKPFQSAQLGARIREVFDGR